MGKGDKKSNIQKDPSNIPEANPNPQKKAKYTKRNWKKKTSRDKIEYIFNLLWLEKNDNLTQEKNYDEITQEDNSKDDISNTEIKLKENQENNDLY